MVLHQRAQYPHQLLQPAFRSLHAASARSQQRRCLEPTGTIIENTRPSTLLPVMDGIRHLLHSVGNRCHIYNLLFPQTQPAQAPASHGNIGIREKSANSTSKINFFTNVAHEIRTPLTLIKAHWNTSWFPTM